MNILKSIGAVLAGLIFIVFTHTAVDKVLEGLGIFPPPEQGLHITWMLVLALAYRTLLSIVGCYLTARLAPSRPMLHSLVLGFIGIIGAVAGTFAAISQNLSPGWYPIALVLVTLPCAWLGGRLVERRDNTIS